MNASKCVFVVCSAVMLTGGQAFADEFTGEERPTRVEYAANAHRGGSKALQFGVKDNFNLTTFQGATISAKSFHADSKALRLGLTLWANYVDSGPSESNRQDVTLVLQDLLYLRTASTVRPYVGVGPNASLSRTKSTSSGGSSTTNTRYALGVSLALGVEWFATRDISLFAEYGSALNYTSTTVKSSSSYGSSSSKWREIALKNDGVLFGIAAYF